MKIPRCEEGRLVEVRRLLLQVWARAGDRGVRRAEALHRVRDAGAGLEEPLLVAYRPLDVSLDLQMVFGVIRLFREDGDLKVRRQVFSPRTRKGIKLRREQIEIIVVRGIRPGPGVGGVVARLEPNAGSIEEFDLFIFAALSDFRRHSIARGAELIASFV